MSVVYKLGIDSLGMSFKIGSTVINNGSKQLVLANDVPVDVAYDGRTFSFSLYGLNHTRKMYEPGLIEAEVLVSIKLNKSETVTMDSFKTMFIRRGVSLIVNDGTKDYTVAEKYYVHSITPRYQTTTSGDYTTFQIYTKLYCYSLDKQLTLNPFSHVYLGNCLVGSIVKDALSAYSVSYSYIDGTAVKTSSAVSPSLAENTKCQLTNLSYIQDPNGTNPKRVEFIQPYLIQYNESFYDFIRRVSNRCGEAMYFENGTLCFGLPLGTDGKIKAAYTVSGAQIIYNEVSSSPLTVGTYGRDSVKDSASSPAGSNSDEIARCDDGFPITFSSDKYPYVSELDTDEHYIVLYKDKFEVASGMGSIWWNDMADAKAMEIVSQLLNATSLAEFLYDLAISQTKSGIRYAVKKSDATDKGNEYVRENAINNNNYATLFAAVDADTSHWVTKKYYSDIKSNQDTLMRGMVCLDLKESYQDVHLGDLIKLSDATDDTAKYVVVKIEMANSVAWVSSYNSYTQGGDEAGQGGTPHMRVYAIPMNGDSFYPPLVPGDLFRHAGPMPAFVTDNADPKWQGRVRVRFGWQPYVNVSAVTDDELTGSKKNMDDDKGKLEEYATGVSYYPNNDGTEEVTVTATMKTGADKSKFETAKSNYKTSCKNYEKKLRAYNNYKKKYLWDSSPWIRVVTPMATKTGGGMYFQPEIGDEVMVDFQHGNIDHPFVAGMLFSKNVCQPAGSNRLIVSRNGHTIRFFDPDDDGLFVSGTYPGLKLLNSFGYTTDWNVTKEHRELGGIEMSDRLGFYRISMSSHNRNVSIESPFGDVKINAFTGITISAPNGDIAIEGKNINIKAQNKVSITSGENIHRSILDFKNGRSFWAKQTQVLGSKLVNEVTEFVDFSLLRSILEVFIRPVDGTLLIKSNRYLLMEAGEGKASIAADQYESESRFKSWAQKKIATGQTTEDAKNIAALHLIQNIGGLMQTNVPTKLNSFVTDFIGKFNAVSNNIRLLSAQLFFFNNGGTSTYVIKDMNTPEDYLKHLITDLKPNAAEAADIDGYIAGKLGAAGRNIQFHASFPGGADYHIKSSVVSVATKVADLNATIDRYEHLFDADLTIGGFDNARVDILSHMKNKDPMGTGTDDAHALYTWIDKVVTNSAPTTTFFHTLDANNFTEWKKMIQRRIAYAIIQSIRPNGANFVNVLAQSGMSIEDENYGQVPDPARIGKTLDPAPGNLANPFTDSDWACYVAGIRITIPPEIDVQTPGTAFGQGAADVFMKKVGSWGEWLVWNDNAKGEIVFSNNKDISYRFNRNGASEKYVTKFSGRAEEFSTMLKDILLQL